MPGVVAEHGEAMALDTSVAKRVLFLAPYLGDGGINTHMLTLGSELQKCGWAVAICSGGSFVDRRQVNGATGAPQNMVGPGVQDYLGAGIEHFEARIPLRPYRLRDTPELLRFPAAAWQVTRAARRFRPALLHSHSQQMGVYACIVHAVLRTPYISSVHSPIRSRGRLWTGATLGSAVIANSDDVERMLIEQGATSPDRLRIVPAGADAEHFRPPEPSERRSAQQHFGIGPGQFVVTFIGTLNTNKSPDTLIDAAADLVSSGHDVVVLMAGEGPMEGDLRNRAAEARLADRVQVLGRQDSRLVLWAADALVLPSRMEGFGTVVAEAMLSRVVVLRTPGGGAVQQITPGVTGMTFPFGDNGELARLIADLIERPDARTAMAGRALEDARARFSSEVMARDIEAIYLSVLQDRC